MSTLRGKAFKKMKELTTTAKVSIEKKNTYMWQWSFSMTFIKDNLDTSGNLQDLKRRQVSDIWSFHNYFGSKATFRWENLTDNKNSKILRIK